MKVVVFLFGLAAFAMPAAGICGVDSPHTATKTVGHPAPMGSLGSGFPTAAGKHGASVGGPTIHGATINGTQTRRKH